MQHHIYHLLLADDDIDDCLFFEEVLEELPIQTNLSIVNDGDELMKQLSSTTDRLPDILFLDLNIPLKSGFECLLEIRSSSRLRSLPVIIFSTSFDPKMVDLLYESGADYYICKPPEFSILKRIIHKAITMGSDSNKTVKENFVLNEAK